MKLMLTGGHITPAIAVIDECIKKNIEVILVGRSYSYKRTIETMESKLLNLRNVSHIHLEAGRFSRTATIPSLIHFIKIPVGFIQSFFIVKKAKPDLVLTFGGYIAFPIAVSSWLLGIPVYLHEQVIIPGITNRVLSKICKKIFISFPESQTFFPKGKTVLTGNPIRNSMVEIKKVQKFEMIKKPLIYVTGGSLGSHAINVHIEHILPQLLEHFTVIHQTGNTPPYCDYDRLKIIDIPDYFVYDHINEDELSYIFQKADVIIGRSGANTVNELIFTKSPSVLIPLPYSGFGEQVKQAELLEKVGCSEIFDQEKESTELFQKIKHVYENKSEYIKAFSKLERYTIRNSAHIILSEMGL